MKTSTLHRFFVTEVFQTKLFNPSHPLMKQLLREVMDIKEQDSAGAHWSKAHYPGGFTSYASANELHRQSSPFAELEKSIDRIVQRFVAKLQYDMGTSKLRMQNCWLNWMEKQTVHSGHIHPLSVISGTFYLQVPPGSSAIRFEDPRLASFMAQPPRKIPCHPLRKNHQSLAPTAGSVILFESWLRHEVPPHQGSRPRISISFNYGWE
jgi:uncharacterized protein (TIGR02466 family)